MLRISPRFWVLSTLALILFSLGLTLFDSGLASLTWTPAATINALLALTSATLMLLAMLLSPTTDTREKKIFAAMLLWLYLYTLTAVVGQGAAVGLHVLALLSVFVAAYPRRQ